MEGRAKGPAKRGWGLAFHINALLNYRAEMFQANAEVATELPTWAKSSIVNAVLIYCFHVKRPIGMDSVRKEGEKTDGVKIWGRGLRGPRVAVGIRTSITRTREY